MLKGPQNGHKIAQYQANLRDERVKVEEGEEIVNPGLKKVLKSRVKHPNEFSLLPFIRRSKDYDTFLPPDKDSISKSKTILIKMTDDFRNDSKYGLKLKTKNANNFRHLVTGQQNNNTLQWEASLRE